MRKLIQTHYNITYIPFRAPKKKFTKVMSSDSDLASAVDYGLLVLSKGTIWVDVHNIHNKLHFLWVVMNFVLKWLSCSGSDGQITNWCLKITLMVLGVNVLVCCMLIVSA